MNNSELIVKGKVLEALPNTTFRIELEEEPGRLMVAYLSGKMRRFRIKVLVGDTVEIVTDISKEKGRITRRL